MTAEEIRRIRELQEQNRNKDPEQVLIEKVENLRALYEGHHVTLTQVMNAERELREWRLRNEASNQIQASNQRQMEAYDELRERNLNPNYDELQSLRERRDTLIEEIENRKRDLGAHEKDYWSTDDGKVLYERHVDAIYDYERELPGIEDKIEQLYMEPREIYPDRESVQVYDPYGILNSQEKEQIVSRTFILKLTSEEERLIEERRALNERLDRELEREFLRQRRQEIYDFLNVEQYSKFDALVSQAEQNIESQIFEGKVTLAQEDEQELQDQAQMIFDNLDLTEDQMTEINHLTGRERIGLAALISGSISGGLQIGAIASNRPISNVPGLYSKWIGDTAGLAMIGNVIYRARKQAEDGLDTDEIMLLVSDGTRVIVSAGKIVLGWAQVAVTPGENGESFFKRLSESYTTPSTLNPRPSKPTTNVLVDADLGRVSTTSGINRDNFMNTPDEVLTRVFQKRPPLTHSQSMTNLGGNSIPSGGSTSTGGTRPHLTHSQSMPNLPGGGSTGGSNTASGRIGKAAGALSLIADVAWLAQAAQDLSDEGSNPDASKIMNVVGAGLCVIGDAISFAGPVGEIVGTIVGGIGCAVASIGSLCDLGPNSSKEEVLKAVGDFALSFGGPLMPNINAVEQAIMYQHLKDNADNDIDEDIYDSFHKISSLDATPIINFFHGIYDDQIRREQREELMERYGNFDNMMKEYIINDSEFQNNLNNAHDFLKENAHTTHTQFLTAYLTPEQINQLFKDEQYHRAGYDVRSIQDNLQVKGEEVDGAYKLETAAGVSVLPAGANLKNIDGREVLDTVSLGYGNGRNTITDQEGNEVENPRVIDTSTQISYSNDQLQMFSTEFKHRHRERYVSGYTSGGCIPGACNVGRDPIYSYREDPRYARFKCWIDVVDDMSGIQRIANPGDLTPEEVSSLPESQKMLYSYHNRTINATLLPINNRVISTISDIIFPKIETKAGDDDVILANVERVYNDGTGDSVVRVLADGGEGNDVLDLTNVKEEGIEGFNFEYSIRDNYLEYNRENSDGKNYDLDFYNFEQIRLGKDLDNTVTIKDGSDITLEDDESLEQIGIVGTESRTNNIDFSGVTGKKLYFAGNIDCENTVKGTENSDTIVIPDLKQDSQGNGFANIEAGAGNDFIIGGNFKNSVESKIGNTIHGGDGTDYIKGSGNYNLLYGDSGDDVIHGSNKEGSYNELFGGEGVDILVAGEYGSILRGQDDNDVIIGKDSADELYGDSGSDYLMGGKGNDQIYGDIGNDYIEGQNGNDMINGGEGNDYLKGNEGQDTFCFGNNFGTDVIADYEEGDVIKFEDDLGRAGNDMLSVYILKSEEKDFVALLTDQGCIKIKGVDSADYLSFNFGDYYLSTPSDVETRLGECMTFEEYSAPFLPLEEESQIAAAPPVSTSLSYSTENQYTEAFSGNNLETPSNLLVS
ncbi:hypothetical protein [Clostridium oceanicum]|uniref:Bifunctional hemolysin/adenylate cyclase n=1 Tax=Clostridium oceanicum TaxID=1543 RepID=A0ABN1J979_9CLOT